LAAKPPPPIASVSSKQVVRALFVPEAKAAAERDDLLLVTAADVIV
jgi:hypothetical protein